MLGRETSVYVRTVSYCVSRIDLLQPDTEQRRKSKDHSSIFPYFGLVEINRAEHVPVHSLAIYDDASVRTTSVVNPTPASLVLDEPHDDVFPSWTVEDDIFFAYHGPWESHLQESSWLSQSVEDDLDPRDVVLGQYLDRVFRFEVRDVILDPHVISLNTLNSSFREKTAWSSYTILLVLRHQNGQT